MKRYKKIPFKKVAEVYRKKGGNTCATCEALNITRRTFQNWKRDYPEFNEMIWEIDESLIDFSESKLIEQITQSNITAIIFHLKTKGKSRGYVEKTENDVNINAFEKLMEELPDEE